MAGSSLKPHSSLYSLARTLAERLFDLQEAGRIMHESWTVTKRSQGFHAPSEHCDSTYRDLISQGMFNADQVDSLGWKAKKPPCDRCHADLVPWEELPQKQKDININAFNDVFLVLSINAEAVIREAIEKTLETARQSVLNEAVEPVHETDISYNAALGHAATAIRSLKQSNSGIEAVDGIHSR